LIRSDLGEEEAEEPRGEEAQENGMRNRFQTDSEAGTRGELQKLEMSNCSIIFDIFMNFWPMAFIHNWKP